MASGNPAPPTPFLGVIEGFYGVFHTFPERIDLIRFIARHGYRQYIYAPKNDRQHRARWWEAYPARVMDRFAETVQAAQECGVSFVYGISPGDSVCYSSPEDFHRITAKLEGFYQIGVRDFSLLLDDNDPGFRHAADAAAYPSLPQAQASLANRLLEWLNALDPQCTLSYCPAEYHGREPFAPALVELTAALHPAIDLFYTGPEICSPAIAAADVEAFRQATGRTPLIWDNYPVNDLSMQPELHLAPISGRAADLFTAVKGILVNPMIQAEASKIPLLTYAAYAAGPASYDPAAAWEQAIETVAGAEFAPAVRLLAEVTGISCLGRAGQKLEHLAHAALKALQAGQPPDCPAIHELEAYLTEIDEAGYTLKFHMENLALRNNLLPWIEIMEHWMWMTRFALKLARALETGEKTVGLLKRVIEYQEAIQKHPKRIATDALMPITEMTIERVKAVSKSAFNSPDFTFASPQ